jgi:ABC-type multidrug transport system permease subunit
MSEPLPRLTTVLAGQLGYQARLLGRTPRAVTMACVFPALLILVRHTASAATPASARDAAVGGVLAFSVIATSFQTHAAGLVAAREAGVLKRLRGTPLPRWCYFAGRIGATCVLALVGAGTALGTAALLGSLSAGAADLAAVLAVTVVAALAWAAVGTAMTVWIPSAESAAPMLSLTMIPLLFFSGLFFPVSEEPSWLARVAGWLPAEPFADAVGRALAGGIGAVPVRDTLTVAAWGAVALAVAVRAFRWDPVPVAAGRADATDSAAAADAATDPVAGAHDEREAVGG